MADNMRGGLVLVTLLLLNGCTSSQDTLATFDGGKLTLSDLSAYLLALPEQSRQFPAGEEGRAFMEEKLRQLAMEEILAASPEMEQLQAAPEFAAQGLWLRTAALEGALLRELAESVELSPEEIEAAARELSSATELEPQLNFRHLYLRLDLAASPRARQEKRKLAQRLEARLRSGEDFAELVRQHSDSSNAPNGGLVVHTRPSDLDEVTRAALAALEENELSGVVETRTGLHIFQLIRRLVPQPLSPQQLEAAARRRLRMEAIDASRRSLIERLSEQETVELSDEHWRVGDLSLPQEALTQLVGKGEDAEAKQRVIERLLLATEAIHRGLETPAMGEGLDRQRRVALLNQIFNERRQAALEEVGVETLKPFFEAQPSLFSLPERAHLELLFVPQGRDSFATQKEVEGLVAELRAGASFADLARLHSKGPAAEAGGDLGLLAPGQWAQLGPAMSAAIPQLEVGVVSDPIYCTDRIVTQQPGLLRGGFAVLRVRERQGEQARTFEEAIDDVRRAYGHDRREELDQQLETALLDASDFRLLRLPTAAELL